MRKDKISRIPVLELTEFYHKTNVQQLPYLPTPPLGQDMTQGQFLSGV